MSTRIWVGIDKRTMHCADCNAAVSTTYRLVPGRVFRCPACRGAALRESRRRSEERKQARINHQKEKPNARATTR